MDNIEKNSRMGNFIKNMHLELVQNKKTILLSLLSIWGVFAFVGFTMGYGEWGSGMTGIIVFALMAVLISMIVASMSFSNMKTKEQRIFSLMVPASPEAKFLTKWLIAVPVLFGVLLIGYYVGEFARIGTFALNNTDYHSHPEYMTVKNPFSFFSTVNGEERVLVLCCMLASYFLSQSFYLLGGVLWPKLSFIKTFAAIYVVQTVVGIILMAINRSDFFRIFVINGSNIYGFLWVMFGVMVAITLLCYWLTYIRYRRCQVVYKLF